MTTAPRLSIAASLLAFTFVAAGHAADVADVPQIIVTADHADGIYDVGQTVHWSVKATGVTGPMTFAVLPNQGKPTAIGTLDPAAGPSAAFDAPGTILVKITGKDAAGKEVVGVGGAVAGMDKIALSAPRPDDFDAFWADKIKELDAVPVDAVLTAGDSGKSNVIYEQITMNNIRGAHIRGQIARPKAEGKHPAVLVLQWAGIYGLQKSWVVNQAAGGWLSLNINPHDLPIDQPEAFYKAQGTGPLKNYWAIGNDDRETSYYLRMYLSCYRAVQYLKSRPDWDGKTLVVIGNSQGGMQTLMTAGLCPDDVTAAIALVPAGCDMLGPTVGRRGGWPQWYDWTKGVENKGPDNADKVHEASRYFDVANFTPKIQCPVLVGTGLLDETCPADGVIAAFNQIKSSKQLVVLPQSPHQDVNHSQQAFNDLEWKKWMPALRKGEPAPVK